MNGRVGTTGLELISVLDAGQAREVLDVQNRPSFWLLDHDPLWQSALLGKGDNSLMIARRNGVCLVSLFVHDSGLDLSLGALSLASISVRRHVLTGGIPADALSMHELTELLIGLAARIGPTGVIFLQGVHDTEPLRAALDTLRLRRTYYVMHYGRHYQRCRIALRGNFDSYLASLRRNSRKDVKRTLRNFNGRYSGSAELQVVTGLAALEEVLPELIALSAKTYHRRVHGLGPAAGNYVVRQMRFGAEEGVLRLDLLRIDGRLISFQIAYVYRDTLFTTHAGYDPAWSGWSPGIVHLMFIVDDLRRSRPDVHFLDFMYGDAVYKHRLSNTFHGESQFYLIPKTARGFMTWLAVGGVDRVSRSARVLLDKLNLTPGFQRAVRRAAMKLR